MTEGLRPGDPTTLGLFHLRGRLAEHEAGVVFLGYDPTGRAAALTVLHAGAAADSAVRDRLTSALDALAARGPEQVLGAAPYDAVPWVATAYTDGRPEAALALLDAAGLSAPGPGLFTGPGGGPAGPDFAPHWAGTPAAHMVTPPPPAAPATTAIRPADSKRSLAILALCVAAALVVIVGGAFAANAFFGGDDKDTDASAPEQTPGLPGPVDTIPAMPGPSQSATPAPSRTPPPWMPTPGPSYTGPDGPDGLVAGPTFGKEEPTYPMDLNEFPFDFRVPKTWGCMKSSKGGPGVVRWVCVDESFAFSGKPGRTPGGIIEVQDCPSPCGSSEWTKIRDDRLPTIPTNWKRTDDTTTYAEWTVGAGDTTEVSAAMSHVFGAKRGDAPDTHVTVRLTGAPSEKKNLQKIINDIRARTP
ncbi:hypothetical protein [Actinopolymorpha alba]|uniref:hypothetical protein n=1 Tax=Actinopolymorpha alba TaxID=533267 RepID=UPI00039B79FD|nr:hypothetical protein [Actinopolymorpha alba]